jgi:hypothetical protein
MSRHRRSSHFTAGAQHVLAPVQLPVQLPSVKWLNLIIMLLLVASFCFVGGAAWQRLKDREERLKQDPRSKTIVFGARPEQMAGEGQDSGR